MTPEEIQAMAKGLAQGQAVWYVLSACIGGALAFLGAYGAEKAKNHATKQDIGEITNAVKAVEAGFNRQLEELKAHHQLRMVVAERRMQAHQEAYSHWLKLFKACASEGEIVDPLKECHDWYAANCIFLGVKSRAAFWQACVAGSAHKTMRNQDGKDPVRFLNNWQVLENAGNVFTEEVALPGLNLELQREVNGVVAPT